MSSQDFKSMLEASYEENQLPEIGKIIKTTVIQITDKEVILDVGSKSESSIGLNEFKTPPKVGEEIEVFVEKSGENYVKVSFAKASEKKAFAMVKNAFQSSESVEGKITEVVKGGFKVLLEEFIQAFLPLSQLDLNRIDEKQLDQYKNKAYQVKVIKFEDKGRNINIVVSRIPLLEIEKNKKVSVFFQENKIGDEVKGKVVKINPKSVIVEIEGLLTGLIRIGDLSWDRIEKPEDVVKNGESLNLRIIKMDPEKNEVLLSLKDMKQDPWVDFAKKHQEGDVIRGEVVKIHQNKQVFVKVEEGIDGFIRFEDLSWSKTIRRADEAVELNAMIDTKILEINPERKKLLLGLKQMQGDPWNTIDEKYPKGKKVKGKILDIKDFGVFVELENGIEALLHKNDIDWNLNNSDLTKYNVGDEIEVIITNVNKKERKISVGIKQLFDNPWDNFASEYPKGSIIKGKVKEIKEKDLIIEFENQIEGSLYIRELEKKIENLSDHYKIGDEVEAMVIDINPKKSYLKLSIREMVKREREKDLENYINQTEEVESMSFGDLLGNNLDKIKNKIQKNAKIQEESKTVQNKTKSEEPKEQ